MASFLAHVIEQQVVCDKFSIRCQSAGVTVYFASYEGRLRDKKNKEHLFTCKRATFLLIPHCGLFYKNIVYKNIKAQKIGLIPLL